MDGPHDAERPTEAGARSVLLPAGLPGMDNVDETFHEIRVHQIELELQNEQMHEAQSELETARAKYFDLYELAPVGYVTLDEVGRVVEANLAASRLLFLDRKALVGRAFATFLAAGDQDTYYLFLRDLFTSEWPRTCEVRLRREADDPVWLRLDATPREVDETGSTVTRMTLTDVSEAQRTARLIARLLRMRDAAEQVAHAGTWSVDLRTWKTRWSPEMLRLFDLDADAAEDMMEAIAHRVHPDDRSRVKADMADLVITRVAGHEEFRVVWRDGNVHFLTGACGVHHDPGGEETELVGSSRTSPKSAGRSRRSPAWRTSATLPRKRRAWPAGSTTRPHTPPRGRAARSACSTSPAESTPATSSSCSRRACTPTMPPPRSPPSAHR